MTQLCRHFTISEQKALYKSLSSHWLVDSVTSAEDFASVAERVSIESLSTFLDSEKISKKNALAYFSALFEITQSNLSLSAVALSLVLSHEKTKSLIERSFDGHGDLIDITHNSPDCLAVVLGSDYYNTADGVRALNAALIRHAEHSNTVNAI